VIILIQKILGIVLLVIGEALSIYIELSLAKNNSNLLIMVLVFTAATPFLLYGYMWGYSAFKSIWVVSIISITSILIIEPVLCYSIFKELPTKGALMGLVFGILGFISAIFL
jgi:hypothetical protein